MKSKIKTFENACTLLKLNSKHLPIVKALPKQDQAALVAHYKLIIIARALNQESNEGKPWQPNWHDYSSKYYPYFTVKASAKVPSGFGFSFSNCDSWYSATSVGSRLCYRTSELALYAGKQFKKLYQEYFLIS